MNPLSTIPLPASESTYAPQVSADLDSTASSVAHLGHSVLRDHPEVCYQFPNGPGSAAAKVKQQDWADQMLTERGLDLNQQSAWIERLQQRSESLGYGADNPLFVVIDRNVLFKTKLVKPLDDVKLVIADLYREKYGVRLVIETGKFMEPADMKAWVEQQLEQANGQEIAILTRTEEPGKELSERNYLWHMTPFIMRESKGLLEVLNLDSAWRVDPGMYKALALMAEDGRQIDFMTLKQKRQADYGSCHVDAMVVAKDTLRALRNAGVNGEPDSLIQYFNAEPNADQNDLKHANVRAFTSELPSFLHKSTQYSKAMRFDDFDPNAQVMSRNSQSISSHRSKYTRNTPLLDSTTSIPTNPPSTKAINHYLTFKGFYLVERALYHLESLGSQEAAKSYVAELQNQSTQHCRI